MLPPEDAVCFLISDRPVDLLRRCLCCGYSWDSSGFGRSGRGFYRYLTNSFSGALLKGTHACSEGALAPQNPPLGSKPQQTEQIVFIITY